MLTLTLVRHASTELNEARRYQSRIDPPLSSAGALEATRLRFVLQDSIRVDEARTHARLEPLVHASDSRRARQTVALALPGVPVLLEPRLRELDLGAFDGYTYDENLERHGASFRAWIDDPVSVRPPGGETLPELEVRVTAWLDELPATGHVIAFTHGGPIHALVARLLGIPFDAARRRPLEPGDAFRFIVPAGASRPVLPPVRLRHETERGNGIAGQAFRRRERDGTPPELQA